MSAYQLPAYVWPATVMTACALAVWRGGPNERLAAGGMLACWALSMVAYQRGLDTEWGILAIDVVGLALFVWIALRSRRFWPLFVAGFQLLAVATHLAQGLDAGVSGWAYITAEIIWGYLVAFTIAAAAWTTPRYGEQLQP